MNGAPPAAASASRTCGRLWWHGVVKEKQRERETERQRDRDPQAGSTHTERQRLHCASCLNADNQLEIYMTVLLHCP